MAELVLTSQSFLDTDTNSNYKDNMKQCLKSTGDKSQSSLDSIVNANNQQSIKRQNTNNNNNNKIHILTENGIFPKYKIATTLQGKL